MNETKTQLSIHTDVMTALIGSCFERFAIRRDQVGEYHYLVRGIEVTRQVFLDSFKIARADRFDPTDPRFRAFIADDDADEGEDDGDGDDAPIVH